MRKNPQPPLPTLPMQLMLTLGCWLSSPFALPCASAAWPLSNNAAKNRRENEALQAAVREEARNRAASLLTGVLHYMDAPYARTVPEPPCVWRRGNARLLDYGSGQPATNNQQPILFIPSLINRYYILDLEEERSFLRYLAAQGLHPLALDWGEPGVFEQSFGCADYVTEILLPTIDFISKAAGGRIALAGYCMGGNFALAAAQLRRKAIAGLALLATPWDFHCPEFSPFVLDEKWLPMVQALLKDYKQLPADVIQSLFYLTDPFIFEQKFRRFAGLTPNSRAAREFIALERWVNDGVPMTAQVAQDCLIGWAQENRLARDAWKVAGKAIEPRRLRMPAFIAIPQQDHVVPPGCATPLAELMPHATVIRPGSGHVSMIVGHRARRELWQKLAEWVKLIAN